MPVGAGDEDDVCAEAGDDACFWTWPEAGALAETEPGAGFWALLCGGAGGTGTGGGKGKEAKAGVTAVSVGVWEAVEVEV